MNDLFRLQFLNLLFLSLASVQVLANVNPQLSPLIEKIDKVRSSVSKAEMSQRRLIEQVSVLNQRIKTMSTQRAEINDKMLGAQGDSQALAYEVREWEERVREQRHKIGKYLGQISQLQNPSVLTFLFSGQKAGEIERNVRFLKLLSERDHKFFIEYQHSLNKSKQARNELKVQVRELLELRKKLVAKEVDLIEEQKGKAKLIQIVRKSHEKDLMTLKSLRAKLPELDQKNEIAIFEKKGSLTSPLTMAPAEIYGTQFDPVYRVKLLHLGWTFENVLKQPVRAIFSGRVTYAGPLPGYGLTVVIDHGDHYYSIYASSQKALAFEGEQVFEGQIVAEASQQLYFELRHFSNALDPEKWIDLDSRQKIAMNQNSRQVLGKQQ